MSLSPFYPPLSRRSSTVNLEPLHGYLAHEKRASYREHGVGGFGGEGGERERDREPTGYEALREAVCVWECRGMMGWEYRGTSLTRKRLCMQGHAYADPARVSLPRPVYRRVLGRGVFLSARYPCIPNPSVCECRGTRTASRVSQPRRFCELVGCEALGQLGQDEPASG